MSADQRVFAVARVASLWREPGHPARTDAVERSLSAPNRFTEEAIAFSVNQFADAASEEELKAWLGGRSTARPCDVAVYTGADTPLSGVRDAVAVLLVGHRLKLVPDGAAPHLLSAFVDEVRETLRDVPAGLESASEASGGADAIIVGAGVSDGETRPESDAVTPSRRFVRRTRRAVAVVDGHETEEEWEGLAEDLLLYEGRGANSAGLIYCPRALSPDPLLNAMAHFRSVIPVHPDTPGSLEMQRAFLEASSMPCAYGDGLEFLLSRGEPEWQPPGHVRWVEYGRLREVTKWIGSRSDDLSLVVARSSVAEHIPRSVPTVSPGEAHRRPISWEPPDEHVMAFLMAL